MKKILCIVLLSSLAAGSLFAGETVPVWFDGYETSATALDVNFEYAARQGGFAVPYLANTRGGGAIAGDYHYQIIGPEDAGTILLLAGDGLAGEPWPDPTVGKALVSPDCNFNAAVGEKMTISFDMDVFVNDGDQGNNYVIGGIVLGASDPLTHTESAAVGFGIRFVEDTFSGLGPFIQLFDGNELVGNLIDNPAGNGLMHIVIDIEDPTDDNPWDGVGETKISLTINETFVVDWTKADGGYTNNYITLEGSADFNGFGLATHHIDNLTVYPVSYCSYCSLWDLNGDCTVDYRDFAVISESWLVPRGFLNESFEEPVLADGEYIQYGPGEDTMVGWTNNLLTADEYVRIVNPAESEVIQPAEGDNYILFSSWLTPGEDNIAQFEGGHENLGNSFHDIRIVPDTTYTVNVKVANPNLFEGAYNIQLVALDDFGEVLEINPLSVSSGNVGAGANWSTASVSWSSSENPEYVGDRLLFSMVGYDIIADDVVFIISGDYNRDGIIGIDDIAVLADRWLD
jgi:hypothetical protein